MQIMQNVNSRIYISKTYSSIPSSRVLSLLQNRQGLIWVGSVWWTSENLWKNLRNIQSVNSKIYFWGFFLYSALGFYFYVWVWWGRSNGRQRTRDWRWSRSEDLFVLPVDSVFVHLGRMIVLTSVKLKTQILPLLEGRWNLLFWCSVKKILTLIPFLLDDLNGQLEHWKPSDIVWVFIDTPPLELKKKNILIHHCYLWVPPPELKKIIGFF